MARDQNLRLLFVTDPTVVIVSTSLPSDSSGFVLSRGFAREIFHLNFEYFDPADKFRTRGIKTDSRIVKRYIMYEFLITIHRFIAQISNVGYSYSVWDLKRFSEFVIKF